MQFTVCVAAELAEKPLYREEDGDFIFLSAKSRSGSRIVGLSPTRGSLAIVVDCQHLWRSLKKVGCLGVQLNLLGLCLGKTNRFRHAAFI